MPRRDATSYPVGAYSLRVATRISCKQGRRQGSPRQGAAFSTGGDRGWGKYAILYLHKYA